MFIQNFKEICCLKKFLTIFIICLTGVWVVPVLADEPSKPLVLATIENLPPFIYLSDGNLTGIDIEVINEMAERMKIQVTIQTYPWPRLLIMLKHRDVDGAFPLFETEERKAFCLYAGLLHYDEIGLVVRKDRNFQFSDITDLYGKTIGKPRAVFLGKEFEQAMASGKISVEEVNDEEMLNIKKLNRGRVDAVAGSTIALMYYVKQLGLEGEIVPLEKHLDLGKKVPAHLVLAKRSPLENKSQLQQKMLTTLAEIWEDGTCKRIYDRHVSQLGPLKN